MRRPDLGPNERAAMVVLPMVLAAFLAVMAYVLGLSNVQIFGSHPKPHIAAPVAMPAQK